MTAPILWTLDALYARYKELVSRRARLILGNRETAKDVTQEVFLRILIDGKVLRTPEPLGWLLKVTTNLCLNRLRDDKRRRQILSRVPANDVDPRTGEARAVIASVLRCLPPDLQEIAIYHHVGEMSCSQIAALVGVSRRTIGNRLVRIANDVGRRARGERSTPASKAAQRVAIAAVGNAGAPSSPGSA